jgi:Protein of unknown function (DUF3575)
MRKINALLIVLFFAATCMAQQKEEKAKPKPVFSPSVAFKWNPESLYFGKVSMFGEFNFKHKSSITLGIGIPFNKNFTYELDDKDRVITSRTFSAMGGYRMYFGKKDMKGLYLEPYLKYMKNDISTTINTDLNGTPTDFVTTSKYSGIGLGLQLGVQFMIAKRVVIDLFFLGPEANSSHHQFSMHDVTSTSWDAQDAQDAQDEIDEAIGDLPIIGNKLSVVVDRNARTVSSDYKGFLPGIRAGLSIGFRF